MAERLVLHCTRCVTKQLTYREAVRATYDKDGGTIRIRCSACQLIIGWAIPFSPKVSK